MIPKELLKRIRRIQIYTSHMVNDLFAGQYHSAFKGHGMEFEEVRQYQIGDDIRTIDWNVSARYGEPYVKTFREERELTVMLLVDVSQSNLFGTNAQLKRDIIAEVCATLAFSAIQNNDKVGLISFSDRIENFVPAKKGLQHVLRVVREILYEQSSGQRTDLSVALQHLNRVVTKRAVVFLVSDFMCSGYEHALRVARRKHDVIPLIIEDRHELNIPNIGVAEFLDTESGQSVVVDTSSRQWREDFRKLAAQRIEAIEQLMLRLGLDTIRIKTGESFVEPLTYFFRKRMARLAS